MAKTGWVPPFNRARHEQTAQYRLWQAMRVHRRFTFRDLFVLEVASEGMVRRYCWVLSNAGYLRREGTPGHEQVFRLVRDTGPYAPQVRRDGKLVRDLNVPFRVWLDESLKPCGEPTCELRGSGAPQPGDCARCAQDGGPGPIAAGGAR